MSSPRIPSKCGVIAENLAGTVIVAAEEEIRIAQGKAFFRKGEISGMRKTYTGGFEALKGIDLTMNKGNFALLGPNGAGKIDADRHSRFARYQNG
ncbi:MAG: hypothetical protein U1F27_17020 [Turneriella sp.]